jgi:hypothetical protein
LQRDDICTPPGPDWDPQLAALAKAHIDIAARWNLLAAETERRMTRESESRESERAFESKSDGDRR